MEKNHHEEETNTQWNRCRGLQRRDPSRAWAGEHDFEPVCQTPVLCL